MASGGRRLDLQAEFRDNNGQLLGYALTGAKAVNKVALNKELPAVLLSFNLPWKGVSLITNKDLIHA